MKAHSDLKSEEPLRLWPWEANGIGIERLARIGCLTLIAASGARGQVIVVGFENVAAVPIPVLGQAEVTAADIYARIGVKLNWRSRGNADICMQFDADEGAGDQPRALGYAMPYGKSGTLIHVLFDRLESEVTSERQAGALLGHVMAHELGHVLGGTDWHAQSGVMEARWSQREVDGMVFRPLSFSPVDLELIQEGVARMTRSRASPLTIQRGCE